MRYDFYKYHALGNDYLVIDPNKTNIKLTQKNIRLICNRNFGIGSDGILYGPFINDGKISLQIYNPDGSEAEKSGNGVRIFSKYLFENDYLKNRRFFLNTAGGEVSVEVLDRQAENIKVDMGKVTFRSDLIPVKGEKRDVIEEELEIGDKSYQMTCLSIGNPHCVIPVKDISKKLAFEIGPLVEKHHIFPNRINMQLLKIIDRENIQIEIWERGAGYTLASGSSSCAAASVAYKLGKVDEKINVQMPGGTILIEIKNNQHVLMTGPVSGVSRGFFTDDLWKELKKRGKIGE